MKRAGASRRLRLWTLVLLEACFAASGLAQSPPTLSAIPDQRTFSSLSTRAVAFIVSDAQTPADQLAVTGSCADPSLVPGTNIVFGGSGSNRTVTIIPAGIKGTNTITVTVQNLSGLATNQDFQIAIADFSEVPTSMPQLDCSSVAWGDMDNDGVLDLLVTGSTAVQSAWWIVPVCTTALYRNNGDETFTNTGANLKNIADGSAVWGDYNNDGRLDVALTGFRDVSSPGTGFYANIAQWIYRNDGSNNFVHVASFENPNAGSFNSAWTFPAAWGDYDGDGKLDVVFLGWPFSNLVHNDGNDAFSGSGLGLPTPKNSSVSWADYNNDGKPDLVLAVGGSTTLYQNTGSGNFTVISKELSSAPLIGLAWEDFNNDGIFDLAGVGTTNGIYVGDGQGNFTRLPIDVQGGSDASVAWGDIDNDGLSDLIVASSTGTRIYHNDGNNSFSDMGILLPAAGRGGVAVGDFNNDGRLDIALTGYGLTKIFRNDGAMPKAPPNPPAVLSAAATNDALILSWSAASDSVQKGGFSYNVRVGTTPGGIDVVSPMADLTTGHRRIPALGNAGLNLRWPVKKVKAGTYYWSVQAIDHAFTGSAFAPEQSFTLVPPSITSQPASQTNVQPVASFQVSATGTLPLSYQWYLNGAPLVDNSRISGSSSTNLVISNVQASDFGNYTVVAANVVGAATSVAATVTILSPVVTNQPQGQFTWLGSYPTLSVVASGQGPFTYQWRFNGVDITDATNSTLNFTNFQLAQFGNYDVIITDSYGSTTSSVAGLGFSEVAAWGVNTHGSTSLTNGLTNIMAIACAPNDFSDCAALKRDGTVVSWPGTSGRLASNLIALASTTTLGLKADGTVVQWATRPPTLVAGLSNIVAIAPYNYGYLALMSNGNVVGNASIAGLTNVVAIAEGAAHGLALRADGTVRAWGNNSYGQTTVPSGLSNVVAIAAGAFHSLALKGDGTVLAWGRNLEGETNVPSGLSSVVSIAGGSTHSLALRSDGTAVSWGANTNVPTGLSNVVAIAAGNGYSLALVGTGPPVSSALLSSPTASANSFSAALASQSGRVYALQYKNSLTNITWTSLPLRAGNGGVLRLTDPAATDPERFYRVLRW